jgi:hypothetical protein
LLSMLRTYPVRGCAAAFRSRPVTASGLRTSQLFLCSSRYATAIVIWFALPEGPDVSRRAANVLVCVSPDRRARSTRCMAAGRPYLYLIYNVDQIACDFRSLAREFVARAYMRRRMVLLIEIHKVISIFSVIRNHGERFRLSMGFITTL